jgi:hypothetical protein
MTRFQHPGRDERGMSVVSVGVGCLAFVASITLAIDVRRFMTARSQAQAAADAGALAGAAALAFNDYDDRSTGGPAVQSAVNTAMSNRPMFSSISVGPADVLFPLGPGGVSNRVRVNVFRTGTRDNPVPTLIGPVLGVPTVDIRTTATAEALPANAMTCVKPFTLPDRWVERSAPPWTPASTFDRYDEKGNLLPNADVYVPTGSNGYSGYSPDIDRGTSLMIREGNHTIVAGSLYRSWSMPGGNGGSWYRDNITGCNATIMHFGDVMAVKPGNLVETTTQGVDALLASDPDAYWDEPTHSVHSSLSPSPRVLPIPLYDPEYYAASRKHGRSPDLKVANWIGFFLVERQGDKILGRITPIPGMVDGDAGPAPLGAFPKSIRLVE